MAVYATTTSSFVPNEHEVMLPVTVGCPTVLDFDADEFSSVHQPDAVNQANLRESVVNISPHMFS